MWAGSLLGASERGRATRRAPVGPLTRIYSPSYNTALDRCEGDRDGAPTHTWLTPTQDSSLHDGGSAHGEHPAGAAACLRDVALVDALRSRESAHVLQSLPSPPPRPPPPGITSKALTQRAADQNLLYP